jgi:hypothetical protein
MLREIYGSKSGETAKNSNENHKYVLEVKIKAEMKLQSD